MSGVTLEQRTPGGLWAPAPVAKVKPSAAGAVAVALKPQVTTQYRLAAGTARSEVVKVVVAHATAQGRS